MNDKFIEACIKIDELAKRFSEVILERNEFEKIASIYLSDAIGWKETAWKQNQEILNIKEQLDVAHTNILNYKKLTDEFQVQLTETTQEVIDWTILANAERAKNATLKEALKQISESRTFELKELSAGEWQRRLQHCVYCRISA